ncbi:hypothetical protein KM043_003475 [Ampulex compressa]|nr:hypothetical protein KM043_003475 [Ampulex compressa]
MDHDLQEERSWTTTYNKKEAGPRLTRRKKLDHDLQEERRWTTTCKKKEDYDLQEERSWTTTYKKKEAEPRLTRRKKLDHDLQEERRETEEKERQRPKFWAAGRETAALLGGGIEWWEANTRRESEEREPPRLAISLPSLDPCPQCKQNRRLLSVRQAAFPQWPRESRANRELDRSSESASSRRSTLSSRRGLEDRSIPGNSRDSSNSRNELEFANSKSGRKSPWDFRRFSWRRVSSAATSSSSLEKDPRREPVSRATAGDRGDRSIREDRFLSRSVPTPRPRMWTRIDCGVAMFLALLQLSRSAMVLPRPPSSHPNQIREDHELSERKVYEGKALHGFLQSTNVERPDTQDYRLVEIEVQSPDDVDATQLQSLVHAMLKNERTSAPATEGEPNPEVIPHSILGVRDMGMTPNFRGDAYDIEDKRLLLGSTKHRGLGEKLYYLKNGRPRVYVNVRGHSGAFRKEESALTTSGNGPVGFLRVTPAFRGHTDWKRDKKPPKKYLGQADQLGSFELTGLQYEASTTENSMVTSSELPKQIPAPPSKLPGRSLMAQTTPVQRYALRRTDILPGYGFSED